MSTIAHGYVHLENLVDTDDAAYYFKEGDIIRTSRGDTLIIGEVEPSIGRLKVDYLGSIEVGDTFRLDRHPDGQTDIGAMELQLP